MCFFDQGVFTPETSGRENECNRNRVRRFNNRHDELVRDRLVHRVGGPVPVTDVEPSSMPCARISLRVIP